MIPRLLNVLIIEEQAADLETLLRLLRSGGFEPVWRNVHGFSDFLNALADPPDIILADYTLANISARLAIETLQEKQLDIPVIVVSRTIREDVAVECMKMGAADYMSKDRLSRLCPAIEQALARKFRRDEHKKAEARLLLLSTAVEQSTEGIAVTDLNGNFLYVNKAMASMHGYKQSDLQKRHVSILYDTEGYRSIEDAHEEVLENGMFTGEISHRVRDQDSFSSMTHISLLRNDAGEPIGMVRTVRDITDRKRAEQKINQLVDDLQRSNAELISAYDATLEGWVRFLDLRDHATEGHSQRVTRMTLDLARRVGFNGGRQVHLRRGALLHDIGKMGIPDRILQKPGPLDDEEWLLMRKHPEFAYRILSRIEFLRPALDIPRYHHEKWDGSGYPDHLSGDSIPLPARLFAIVDVWDALKSDRPYRKAWPQATIVNYLRQQAGNHFDPDLVPIFLDYVQPAV